MIAIFIVNAFTKYFCNNSINVKSTCFSISFQTGPVFIIIDPDQRRKEIKRQMLIRHLENHFTTIFHITLLYKFMDSSAARVILAHFQISWKNIYERWLSLVRKCNQKRFWCNRHQDDFQTIVVLNTPSSIAV